MSVERNLLPKPRGNISWLFSWCVCCSTWVFSLVASLQRPPLQRKKDKTKIQSPFSLLHSTDLSVVIMWISFCTLGRENKRFSGGQSFEVTQAIANISFKEAQEGWILIRFFSPHNFKERRGVAEVCSDLAETIYSRIIIRNTADTFRMNSIIVLR